MSAPIIEPTFNVSLLQEMRDFEPRSLVDTMRPLQTEYNIAMASALTELEMDLMWGPNRRDSRMETPGLWQQLNSGYRHIYEWNEKTDKPFSLEKPLEEEWTITKEGATVTFTYKRKT